MTEPLEPDEDEAPAEDEDIDMLHWEPPHKVGRLLDPDMGAFADTESEAVAYDTGDLRGLSAEEAAIHLVPEKELEEEGD